MKLFIMTVIYLIFCSNGHLGQFFKSSWKKKFYILKTKFGTLSFYLSLSFLSFAFFLYLSLCLPVCLFISLSFALSLSLLSLSISLFISLSLFQSLSLTPYVCVRVLSLSLDIYFSLDFSSTVFPILISYPRFLCLSCLPSNSDLSLSPIFLLLYISLYLLH